jgi:hypothetical protein
MQDNERKPWQKGGSAAKAIGAYVANMLDPIARARGFAITSLLSEWPAVVGEELARFTAPEKVVWPRRSEDGEAASPQSAWRTDGAILVLKVDGPRAIEVQHRAEQILERVNIYFGYRHCPTVLPQAPAEGRARAQCRRPASWEASVAAGVATGSPTLRRPVSAARPGPRDASRFCHKELARERETSGKQASGVNPVTETTEKAAPNRTLYIVLGLVLAVAVAAGVYYWRGGFDQSGARVADKDKVDPDVAVLMELGPLPDIIIGSANAPNTIVEYASMTCPHCAQFQTEVFPEPAAKHRQGPARCMPSLADNPAAAAFTLGLRCAATTLDTSNGRHVLDCERAGRCPRGCWKAPADRQAGRHLQRTVRPVPRQQGAVRQDREDPRDRQ